VNCVVDGGAASSACLDDLIAQHACVTRESLDNLRLIVEGHRESLILATAQNGVEKIHGGVLLTSDAAANAVGRVHQQADGKRAVMAWRMVRNYRKPASDASIFDEPLAAANFSK